MLPIIFSATARAIIAKPILVYTSWTLSIFLRYLVTRTITATKVDTRSIPHVAIPIWSGSMLPIIFRAMARAIIAKPILVYTFLASSRFLRYLVVRTIAATRPANRATPHVAIPICSGLIPPIIFRAMARAIIAKPILVYTFLASSRFLRYLVVRTIAATRPANRATPHVAIPICSGLIPPIIFRAKARLIIAIEKAEINRASRQPSLGPHLPRTTERPASNAPRAITNPKASHISAE